MDRIYRANVRVAGFQAGELVTISEERLPEYAGLIERDWLTEVRTPQGRLADLAVENATQEGAADGPASEGDAAQSGDGADSHDVGRTEPEALSADLTGESAAP